MPDRTIWLNSPSWRNRVSAEPLIRIGMSRADTHALRFGLLMAGHDRRILRNCLPGGVGPLTHDRSYS